MKNMEITDIRIKKVASEGKMKAVASVTFDNAFAVHDVKVIEGPEKLFVAMPSRRTPDGEYRDIAHPINRAFHTPPDLISENLLLFFVYRTWRLIYISHIPDIYSTHHGNVFPPTDANGLSMHPGGSYLLLH